MKKIASKYDRRAKHFLKRVNILKLDTPLYWQQI